jgi:sugar phosphate isomerase/epimerase
VTHIDVTGLKRPEAAQIRELADRHGVAISGLGYYPNPLTPNAADRRAHADHMKQVILASELLEVGVFNTFVGRDPSRSVEDNWKDFRKVWRPMVKFAEDHGVRIGIENCPMLFTLDEWPGGKNLAISPAIWRRMFEEIPSRNFGLNYDPSHLVWQQIDYVAPLAEFRDRLVHVHAKDARVDRERLNQVGVLSPPNHWHTPKLPGLGDVHWGRFFAALSETGYDGPVCVEVEDRAYEGSLENRQRALVQSRRYLDQFVV